MAKPYSISIVNGTGSANVIDGEYSVSSNVVGYDNNSIEPNTVIINGVETKAFTISASGTLTLRVTEDGTSSGIPIEGAKFVRCDKDGNTYGNEIITTVDGTCSFQNVPYDTVSAPNIYYKQIESDGNHNFDNTLKTINLMAQTFTQDVINAPASQQTMNLTDKYYTDLPIESGTITLS